MSISNERQNEILGNVLDWFSEHYEQEELLNILHDKLGMLIVRLISLGLILIAILKMKKISQSSISIMMMKIIV
mgnify:CR=1 FL=1